jgi:mitogen-activated protein kinase organizer 1
MSSSHAGPVYAIKFSYSGEYIMTASEDRSVSLYNPNKNIMIKNYKNLHNYDITCIDIAKDNAKFCTGGGDKIVMVMDVLQGISNL